VLYVCATRPRSPRHAEDTARREGEAYAAAHGLEIVATITDPYGVPDPRVREGWQCVRSMAADGEMDTVITRWHASVAPDSAEEARDTEIAALSLDPPRDS
jgi:hypothetical protein